MEFAEVAVIGAGPIGLELAVALKREGLPYLHFDAGQIGSTIAWYPLQMQLHSTPDRIALGGVPFQTSDQGRATREEYLAYLRTLVELFDLQVRVYERVVGIERCPEGFELRTEGRGGPRVHAARRVVLAIGNMHRPRRLGIPGEDLPQVSHYFHDPHAYFRQRLVVVGGRNSAIEAAIRSARAGARVTLCHRSPSLDPGMVKPWLPVELARLAGAGRLQVLPGTTPAGISPGRIALRRAAAGQEEALELEADFVLLLTGYEQDTALLERAGVELVGPDRRPSICPQTMETNVPGLFVAGTATAGSPAGKIRVIIESCHSHVPRILAAITGRPSSEEIGETS